MFVCTTILYEYINLLGDIYNLFVNTHVRVKIYREFNHGIIYIDNEVRRVSIHR
jgi:TRAP-type mannitol/chloroaromatic compound transport system permease small subunit